MRDELSFNPPFSMARAFVLQDHNPILSFVPWLSVSKASRFNSKPTGFLLTLMVVKFMDVNTRTTSGMIMVMLEFESTSRPNYKGLSENYCRLCYHWSSPVDSMRAGITVKLNRINSVAGQMHQSPLH